MKDLNKNLHNSSTNSLPNIKTVDPWQKPYKNDKDDYGKIAYLYEKIGIPTARCEIEQAHLNFLNQYALPLAKTLSSDSINRVHDFVAKLYFRKLLNDWKKKLASELTGCSKLTDLEAVRYLIVEFYDKNDRNISNYRTLNNVLKKMARNYFGAQLLIKYCHEQYFYELIAYEAILCCALFNMEPIPLNAQAGVSKIPSTIEKQSYIERIYYTVAKDGSEENDGGERKERSSRTKPIQNHRGPQHTSMERPHEIYPFIEAFLNKLRIDNELLYDRCRLAFLFKLAQMKQWSRNNNEGRLRAKSKRITFLKHCLEIWAKSDTNLFKALNAYTEDTLRVSKYDQEERPYSCWGLSFADHLMEAQNKFIHDNHDHFYYFDPKNKQKHFQDFMDKWFNSYTGFDKYSDFPHILLHDVLKIDEYFDTKHEFRVLQRLVLRD